MARFTHAIVCRLPNNVQLDSHTANQKVDLAKARKEQEEFCEVLRNAGLDVVELAPEDSAPASTVFVEDLAVVCNGTALVARPTRPSRRKEIAGLLMELGIQTFQIDALEEAKKKVLLECSDVLFTGREFFVGLSKRTNIEGAMELANTFPEFPVTPVNITGNQPLKRHVSLAAPGVLCVGQTKEAQEILKRIEREATYRYQTITVPKEEAVNCLNVNGSLIYRGEWTDVAEKLQTLKGECSLCPIGMTELGKFGGLLSQHCILVRKIKLPKKL